MSLSALHTMTVAPGCPQPTASRLALEHNSERSRIQGRRLLLLPMGPPTHIPYSHKPLSLASRKLSASYGLTHDNQVDTSASTGHIADPSLTNKPQLDVFLTVHHDLTIY